jgi:hypothetical protein
MKIRTPNVRFEPVLPDAASYTIVQYQKRAKKFEQRFRFKIEFLQPKSKWFGDIPETMVLDEQSGDCNLHNPDE